MSQSYAGNYTNNLFNPAKRFRLNSGGSSYLAGGFAKGVPLADSELREIADVSDTFIRQLVAANFPRGSSTNNGFKVIESASPTNNFTVKGGDGTWYNPGILFVDGYILFLKSDIEYNQQDATGAITDDDYTKTIVPALTTPGGARTDEVYVDFYFAEVAAGAGSEYQDASLIVSGLGSATANRVRMVQDIRVAENGTTPTDGNDGNGIYHRYVKIATLARTATASITTAMITDNRIKINSVNSYSQGTTITDLIMTNGQNIGNDTHRVGSLYMSSNIDYSSQLVVLRSGSEKARFDTAGKLGIGTNAPERMFQVSDFSSGEVGITIQGSDTHTGRIDFKDTQSMGAISYDHTNNKLILKASNDYVWLTSTGRVGIATSNPQSVLHVQGDALISNNLTVNGTTTTVNTEVTTTDMMTINQDDNQVALAVNQTTAGNGASVLTVSNAGTGAIASFVGVGTGTAKVGIGTASPQTVLDVYGGYVRAGGDGTTSGFAIQNGSSNASIYLKNTGSTGQNQFSLLLSSTEALTINNSGNVGIGTTVPVGVDIKVANASLSTQTSQDRVQLGSLSSGRTSIWFDTADTTFTNRKWFIENVGSLGVMNIGRSGINVLSLANDGKVGIGSDSPAYNLTVGPGTGARYLAMAAGAGNDNVVIFRQGATNRYWVGMRDSGYPGMFLIYDSVGNANRIGISSAGLVGIGTNDPTSPLDLTTASTGRLFRVGRGGSTGEAFGVIDDGSNIIRTYIGGGTAYANAVKKLHIADYTNNGSYNLEGRNNYFAIQSNPTSQPVCLQPDGGSVGIATTNPQEKLHLEGGGILIRRTANYPRESYHTFSDTLGHRGILTFFKSHNNTLGINSTTADGENIGDIAFSAVNGSNAVTECANIYVNQDGAAGATYVPSRMYFRTSSSTGINQNQLVLSPTGYVGIGTNNALAKFHVETASADSLTIRANGAASYVGTKLYTYSSTNGNYSNIMAYKSHSDTMGSLVATTDGEYLGGYESYGVNSTPAFAKGAAIYFRQNGAAGATYVPTDILFQTATNGTTINEKMRLTAAGSLGIGTTAPISKLHVEDGTLTVRRASTYNDNWLETYDSSTTYSRIFLAKSESATIGTKTQTSTGSWLGAIIARGVNNASAFADGAYVGVVQNGAAGTKVPADILLATSTNSATNEVMRITTGGNVGVGTTNPTFARLQVEQGSIGARSNQTGGFIVQTSSDTNYPIMEFYRTRGTVSGITTTLDGDMLGRINIYGVDNTGVSDYAAVISVVQDGTSAGQPPAQIIFSTSDGSSCNPKMVIRTDGKVGIGTNTPLAKLHVNGDCLISNGLTVNGTTTTINTETTSTDMMVINQDDNQVALGVNQITAGRTATVLALTNAGTGPAATFVGVGTGTARVGIGTTNPDRDLHIYSTTSENGITIHSGDAAKGWISFKRSGGEYGGLAYNHSTNLLSFKANNESMWLNSSGNLGMGTANPQARLNLYNATAASYVDIRLTTDAGSAEIYKNGSAATEANALYVTNTNHPIVFIQAGSERMRVHTGGNVGVGTTNPQFRIDAGVLSGTSYSDSTSAGLRVNSAGHGRIAIETTSAGGHQVGLQLKAGSTVGEIRSTQGLGQLSFVTDSGERMRITSGGDVGIGTTSPGGKLDVVETNLNLSNKNAAIIVSGGTRAIGTYTSAIGFRVETIDTMGAAVAGIQDATDQDKMGLSFLIHPSATGGDPLVESMRISSGGNVGIGTTNPQAKLHVMGSIIADNVGNSTKPFFPLGRPRIIDLTSTDLTLKGYRGAFCDGRYGYFVPYNNGAYFGKVARVDLNDFATVSYLDLTTTNANLKGFQGGFTDGRYGYFVPSYTGAYSGLVARVDLSDFSTVATLDLTSTNANLKGFLGGFTDGRYGYFVPNDNGAKSGLIARVDLNNFSSVATLDLTSTDSALKGFAGGFTDGQYGYFVPNNNGSTFGKIARVDLSDFTTVTVLDLTSTDVDLKGFYGGFTDGRYGYFVPNNNGSAFGKIARVDLRNFISVTVLDLTSVYANLAGFQGGFTDGRYGYFVPNNYGSVSGIVARVDLNDFSTIKYIDLGTTDANLKGFVGGFTDGRYGYFVPDNNGSPFGKVARILVESGATIQGSI